MRIYTHDTCLQHEVPSGHPERPARLDFLLNHLAQTGFTKDHPLLVAPTIAEEMIARAHHRRLAKTLADATPRKGLVALDEDTWLSPASVTAARHAAGAVWQGVNDVVNSVEKRVFCAVRPPGHHAESNTPMGFCLLNSVAIAAINALSLPDIERVAILDFDVHHGNGTVEMSTAYPDILVCSSFQHPYYPGRYHEVAQPNIVNTPLAAGTSGPAFRRAIAARWWPEIEKHRPDLILISAGFDGHKADPLAQWGLVEADYSWITAEIVALAGQYAQGRIVSVLEGGYDLDSLAASAMAHLEQLV
ncbi:MAG: histone deacetylase family protein [Luminiphilus sp.]|nr:histone deacetylase family protein [Luminiphilus sp.]